MAKMISTELDAEVHSRLTGVVSQSQLTNFRVATGLMIKDLCEKEGFDLEDVVAFLAGHILTVAFVTG